jgi:hypothetical protein
LQIIQSMISRQPHGISLPEDARANDLPLKIARFLISVTRV